MMEYMPIIGTMVEIKMYGGFLGCLSASNLVIRKLSGEVVELLTGCR